MGGGSVKKCFNELDIYFVLFILGPGGVRLRGLNEVEGKRNNQEHTSLRVCQDRSRWPTARRRETTVHTPGPGRMDPHPEGRDDHTRGCTAKWTQLLCG